MANEAYLRTTAILHVLSPLTNVCLNCLWWVDLGWLPGIHHVSLPLFLHQQDKGRKYDEKLLGEDKDTETHNTFIMLCLCCSFLFMLFPCCSIGSRPQYTVLHELLQHGSFPQAAFLQDCTHGVQAFRKSLLQRESLMGHRSCQKNCSSVGSSPWTAASFRTRPPAPS